MHVPYSVVLVTVPNKKVADKLSCRLLHDKLAACINQIPQVYSRYRWRGKIEESKELLLMIKTRSILIQDIIQCVRENHPYTVPEIISIPIANGHKDYLNWIGTETNFTPTPDQRIGSSRLRCKAT